VKSCSGGERNRLLLARLFTRPSNVLVLDEPTNDLDIETLELLEELLAQYDGTLFLVSHDRAFLDNVVTQVIAFEGDGKLMEYAGGDDRVRVKIPATAATAKLPTNAACGSRAGRKPKAISKLSHKEARELEELPARGIERADRHCRALPMARHTAAMLSAPSNRKRAARKSGEIARRCNAEELSSAAGYVIPFFNQKHGRENQNKRLHGKRVS
jgi:ATP-binding cassette subfamily F protein uup